MNSIETIDPNLSRRAFLSASGALVITFALPAELGHAASFGATTRPAVKPTQLDSYITIESDGTVVGYYGKIDGGQGLETAMAQMIAEEIDVPYERVRIVMGDTALTVDMGGATADTGISQGGMMLRGMAAEARRLMIEMASKSLNIPAEQLTVTDGVVHAVGDASKRISYAELIGGNYFGTQVEWNGKLSSSLVVKGKAPLKKPEQFKIIGQSLPRRDLPDKVFGRKEFVNDVKLPGMVHARMIRPEIAGAVPVSVDEASVKHIPGVQVVWIKDLLAVVAEKEWNAVKAARELKVKWSESKPNFPGHEKLFDYIRTAQVAKRDIEHEDPGVDDTFKKAARVMESEYEHPTQSHAAMGPACSVADVRPDSATVWSSTQKPYDSSRSVAELVGLPRDKVRCIWMFGTGSYGRCGAGDATADAAVLSKHLGKPVRVQYMRHEGLAWDPKGTATINRSRIGLDASGKVIAYENMSRAFSRNDCATREARACDTLAGHLLEARRKRLQS
jgi:nicotinate dehydrogenase subunit B